MSAPLEPRGTGASGKTPSVPAGGSGKMPAVAKGASGKVPALAKGAAARGASGAFATAGGPRIQVPSGDPGALARLLADAPARATLVVPEGTYAGPLVVRREVTIAGQGPTRTRLTGNGTDGVILLAEAGAKLRLSGAAIVEGAAATGGAIAVMAGRALLEDVVILACRAATCGGAVFVAAGELALRRALVHRCQSPIGGALLLDGTANVALEDVVIEDNDSRSGGGIFLREGARLRLAQVFVRRNGASQGASALEAQGSLSRAPAIEMQGGALAGGRPTVRLLTPRGARRGPTFTSSGATLEAAVKDLPGFADKGGNTFV